MTTTLAYSNGARLLAVSSAGGAALRSLRFALSGGPSSVPAAPDGTAGPCSWFDPDSEYAWLADAAEAGVTAWTEDSLVLAGLVVAVAVSALGRALWRAKLAPSAYRLVQHDATDSSACRIELRQDGADPMVAPGELQLPDVLGSREAAVESSKRHVASLMSIPSWTSTLLIVNV